jgi:hypothetical protein
MSNKLTILIPSHESHKNSMRQFFNLTLVLLFASIALSACGAFRPTPPPTPTLDVAHWKVYQDPSHHFSFEYPKGYDDRPDCAIQIKQPSDTSPIYAVIMNNDNLRVSLTPLDNPKDTDPQTAVNDLRSFWSQSMRVTFDKQVKLTISGIPAISQRYHTVYSKDGYLEDTFFKKNEALYTISINLPATCDGYPDIPTTVEAYQRILTSLKIQ